MLNTEIKYKLSTDYKELYKLLKAGNIIIGFNGVDINDEVSQEHSKLITMRYNEEMDFFDLSFRIFEDNWSTVPFPELCKQHNIRYIPINL